MRSNYCVSTVTFQVRLAMLDRFRLQSLNVFAVPCICRYRTRSRYDLGQDCSMGFSEMESYYTCIDVLFIKKTPRYLLLNLMRYLAFPQLMDEVYVGPVNLPWDKQDYKQTQLKCYASTKRCESLTKKAIIIFILVFQFVYENFCSHIPF